jgi:hypothetical protein
MAYITTGLTNGGVTAHYKFAYDSALASAGGPEPARTNAAIASCEADYNLMHGWFGGGVNVSGMNVQVTTQSNGASWNGSASSSTIQLNAQGASYSNNPAYLRYLLIAEVVEIFMMAQNIGWFQGSNEGSKGEGLSRFLSGQFLQQNGFLGVGMDADYAVADLWLNSSRLDFVNNAPDDNGYDATNGCTTLFIYYLFSQLGHSIDQIVAAGSSTLAAVYKNLTGDSTNPFPLFKGILDLWFPSQTSSAVSGPNFDDPWPLLGVAYSGVWRSGSGPYYLWTDADQSHFLAKWQTLAGQNLRLTDLEVSSANGQNLFSGVWEEGTDGYYLWINADRAGFLAKWQALASQNLRLVSISHYDGQWAGAWREGSDGYYLWIDADQSDFLAKWQALAPQNLRLVDFETYVVNGQRLWAGVWREGSDGYYLWINASWSNFVAKWQDLAAQNLRLVGVRSYDGLWAGIWRSGSDGYYLWANVSEADFLAKWQELNGDNLRLIDMIAEPLDSSGLASGSMLEGEVAAMPAVERGASSTMSGRAGRALVATDRGGSAAFASSSGAGKSNGVGAGGGLGEAQAQPSGIGGGSAVITSSMTGTADGEGVGGGSVAEAPSGPAAPRHDGAGAGGGSGVARQNGAGQGGGQVSVSAQAEAAATGGAGSGGGHGPSKVGAAERSGASEMRGAAFAARSARASGSGGKRRPAH